MRSPISSNLPAGYKASFRQLFNGHLLSFHMSNKRISKIIRQAGKTAVLVTHDISEAISMSDQIVVLSHRPGRIKSIHNLNALESVSAMDRRGLPEFQELFNTVWEELDVNV